MERSEGERERERERARTAAYKDVQGMKGEGGRGWRERQGDVSG